jgi:hypothetical protein
MIETGRFKRLVGYWRHLSNWWFILLIIGQVYNIVMISNVTWTTQTDSQSVNYSAIRVLTNGLNIANYLIMILIPRLFLFRIRHLEVVLEYLVRIDHILTRIPHLQLSCTSRQRTIAAICISFIFVVCKKKLKKMNFESILSLFLYQVINVISSGVQMYPLWSKLAGSVAFLIFSFVWIFIMLMTCAWFLLFHLSFYNISYRIRLLNVFVNIRNVENSATIGKQRLVNKLRSCGYIFDQICLAFNQVACTFSLSILFFLTTMMLLSTTSLFFCYNYGYQLQRINRASIYMLYFISNIIMVTIILKAAESPSKEVNHKS